MRSARFPALVAGVARLAGLGESPNAESKAKIAEFLTTRAGQAYTWDFWPEWTLCEQRTYRDVYASGTAYAAPSATAAVEVYFPASEKYYQTLRATTGNAPAILTGGVWVVNADYWAECQVSYSGDDWMANLAIAEGTTLRNPDDDRYYACFTTHTSGGSFDGSKFGILTPFERYVAYDQFGQTPIEEVKSVHWFNPRLGNRRPAEMPFRMTDRGVEPRNGAVSGPDGWYWPWTNGGGVFGAGFIPPKIWIQFLRPPPEFSSVSIDPEGNYFDGDVVANDGEGGDGECYKALVDDPGSDLTSASKWEKQLCPKILATFSKRAAAADMLRPDAQHEAARAEDSPAFELLLQAHDKVFASQGQNETAKAETY